jgi:hypothetical protein
VIALRGLASFATRGPEPAPQPRCELCGAPLGEAHRHVVELGARGVQCACRGCALLFDRADADTKFRTVPDRVLTDRAFAMTAEAWARLGVPVALVFFVRDSRTGTIAAGYPGPAGITDGELEPQVWDAVVAATSLASELAPDVEALLVHGERGTAAMSCYLIPITAAYELAGKLRTSWRGFSGGDEARRELAGFLTALDHQGDRR